VSIGNEGCVGIDDHAGDNPCPSLAWAEYAVIAGIAADVVGGGLVEGVAAGGYVDIGAGEVNIAIIVLGNREVNGATAIGDAFANSFAGIASGTTTATVGQLQYEVTTTVTPYYYDYDNGTFGTDNNDSSLYGDMKLVQVTVAWNDGQKFQVDENPDTATDLGTGSITLSDVLSSIAAPSGGKVLLANQGSSGYSPPVDYSPGSNPDIVAIQIRLGIGNVVTGTSRSPGATSCGVRGARGIP